MSHTLPATLPKTMPLTVVVDYSGRISQPELGALDSYAARTHYCPHVVVLSSAITSENTQDLALHIAQTWNLEPNGFLLVVNTSNNTAAMVAGTNLQNRGINTKFINERLMPIRFEKEYAQGNLTGAIRSTMAGVEHKLNLVALHGQKATYPQHQNYTQWPIGLTFISIFFFFVIMAGIMGKASVSTRPRRMQLGGQGYQGEADLAADLEKIHQVLGGAPAVKQVPMKEFVQRANLSRSTQNSLDALPTPVAHVNHDAQASAQVGNYGNQMMAQDAVVEKKILAAESRVKNGGSAGHAPLKLIFEGGHASDEKSAAQTPAVFVDPPVAPESAANFEIPVFKPYEFPEDETIVPSVSSLAPAADVPVPTSALSTNVVPIGPSVAAVSSEDAAQTTESVLKFDQYAQAMSNEPEQGTEIPTWQPASYTMPPTPVLPGTPAMPISQFAASMNSDFTDVLNRSSSTYASLQQSGFMTSTPVDASSASGKEGATPGVCPQCQSEKSPDFSFCLRCGHMFV
ncbi:MAG: hypothetical protein P4L53_16785 [Candidatus Obscuribacterales bacterium]|nr:hypothetical protein [Candidatus Obscuribacterales bacterium]